jgi:hypothetical protein
MKLKHIVMLIPIAGTVCMTSCKKDYLEAEPSQQLSTEQLRRAIAQDPSLLNGSVSGLYTTMYLTGTGGTTGHDDFGQKGYDIYTDMISSDMVLGALNYGWYSTVARYQATTDYTRNEDYMPWRYYYRMIFGANLVIEFLGGDAPQTDKTKRHSLGQAKAMRAYAYFYLSQLYAKTYGDGTEKILPIYLDTKTPNHPKATTKEVYDLMIADLTAAIDYLSDFTRTSKDQVDKEVAKGLLAYVLAARGTNADLTQVITLANDVLAKYPLTTKTQATGGFNNVATGSWVWGVDLTLANGLDLVSWWGQVDLFTYSYAWAGDPKIIDNDLFASIKADDVRKTQFDVDGWPINKFYDPERIEGGQRNIETDYVYMRADELLLLKAEAQARLNQDADARTTLKQLLALRITNYSYVDGLSGQALKDEIYFQTRVEFWGEGKTYLAMKRLKRGCTRGDNHLYFPSQTFAWDAPELTFQIPQAEVLNNPNLNN